jgi:diguanylate cyclase (GGDEF)-like protein
MMTLHRFKNWLLTTDPRQRIRLVQSATACLLMLACAAIGLAMASIGVAPMQPMLLWATVSVLGMLAFFVAVRSGANLRSSEPSLTMPQILFALASCAVGYMLVGRARGAVFPILMLVLMFGLFVLRPNQVRWASLAGVGMIGSAMAVMARREPAVYEPAIEAAHFAMMAVMLPAVGLLAGQLSRMRERLREQKLELAEALTRIQDLATRDDLTGLANRRHMGTMLEQEHTRCARSGQPFCVAVLDIDHFKRVNDVHGHAVGDAVLRWFAAAGRAELRDADLLARWGGEEFLVLLPDTPLLLARLCIERLRAAVATTPIELPGFGQGTPAGVLRLSITVSGGLAEYWPQESVGELVARADRALYDAKDQGRDRIVVA